jgi:uncharacterized protein YfiM (DUF2279 family)
MAKRVTETSDFIAMVQRMHRALEKRATEDPSYLTECIMLAEQLSQTVNVVIASSAARHAMDPHAAPSAGEIAGMLGMSKQAVSDRRKIGDRVMMERSFGEEPMARRERLARDNARKHAETTLAGWLERRDIQVS